MSANSLISIVKELGFGDQTPTKIAVFANIEDLSPNPSPARRGESPPNASREGGWGVRFFHPHYGVLETKPLPK